jgi:5-methylcytosine-specific restriction endonuclease McrA
MSHSLKIKRTRAFKSKNGKCFYCQIPMWLTNVTDQFFRSRISAKAMSRIRCTAEHLEARCDGGSDSNESLVAACWFCNLTRHRMARPLSPDKYREQVMSRVQKGRWLPPDYQQFCRS